jgi:hypothetical protein
MQYVSVCKVLDNGKIKIMKMHNRNFISISSKDKPILMFRRVNAE